MCCTVDPLIFIEYFLHHNVITQTSSIKPMYFHCPDCEDCEERNMLHQDTFNGDGCHIRYSEPSTLEIHVAILSLDGVKFLPSKFLFSFSFQASDSLLREAGSQL